MTQSPSSIRTRAARVLALAAGALAVALSATPALAQHGRGGGGWHGGGFHGHGHHGGGFARGPLWGGVGFGIGLGLGSYYGAPWYPYGYGYPYPGYVVGAPDGVYDAPAAEVVSPRGDTMAAPVIYPRNGQSTAQTAADRSQCVDWSNTQPNAIDPAVFQRAVAACMDARGYTLR